MSKKHYFQDPVRSAEYHKVRPSFHAEALEKFHQCAPKLLYQVALDVGCGTGQSSTALVNWANEVFAIDNSEAMLDQAIKHERIHYLKGEAEHLPFSDIFFDLIFVASSFHWFEKRIFFKQVERFLKTSGKLLIYDSFLAMGLGPNFFRLFNERFPCPYKKSPLNEIELDFFDLRFVKIHVFTSWRYFSKEDITAYFMSLSNISACLERGESLKEIERDLKNLLDTQSNGQPYQFQFHLTEIEKIK